LLVQGAGLPVQGVVLPVTFGSSGLQFQEPGQPRRDVPYDDLITRPGGWNGEALLLEWDSVQGRRSILLDDPDRFRQLVESLPASMRTRLQGWRHDVQRNRRFLHLGLVVVIACTMMPLVGVSILMLNANGLVRRAVERIPVAWEEKLGQQAYRDLYVSGRVRQAGVAAETFAAIAQQLTEGIESPYNWNIILADDGRINAMALPGGTIVVWTGLLREMRSAEELAGVLAHEIQHVLLRHSLQQAVHDMGMRTVLGVALLGDGSLGTVTSQMASTLGSLAYSRRQELEADAAAASLLQQTDWDIAGLATLLQRIDRAANELPAFLATHPRGAERTAAMNRADAAQVNAVTPAWQAVLDSLEPSTSD
jgi:Zn-dependent protease with chaperone function